MDGRADRSGTRRGAPQNPRRQTFLRSRNERRVYYFPTLDTIDLHVRNNAQILQVKYTFGLEAQTHPYHVAVLQGQLRRKLGNLFPDIHHEICQTFDEILPPSELGEHPFLIVLRLGFDHIPHRLGERPRIFRGDESDMPYKQPRFCWTTHL